MLKSKVINDMDYKRSQNCKKNCHVQPFKIFTAFSISSLVRPHSGSVNMKCLLMLQSVVLSNPSLLSSSKTTNFPSNSGCCSNQSINAFDLFMFLSFGRVPAYLFPRSFLSFGNWFLNAWIPSNVQQLHLPSSSNLLQFDVITTTAFVLMQISSSLSRQDNEIPYSDCQLT